MKIIDRLMGRGGEDGAIIPAKDSTSGQLTIADVWKAPADFNRATRRAARLFGRIWRWDLMAQQEGPVAVPPRYVRRHFREGILTHPKTRRERKHRARILKDML